MSSLLGPATDADLRRFQRRRYDLLGEFLTLAEERRLPVLSWRVGNHTLLGESTAPDHAVRLRAWEEWVEVLGLDQWAPSTSVSEWTHLHAVTRDWQGRGIDVAVVADVWDREPAD